MTIKWLYKFSGKIFGTGTGLDWPSQAGKIGLFWLHVIKPNREEIDRICSFFKLQRKKFETLPRIQRSKRYSFKPFSFTLVDYFTFRGKIEIENILFVIGDNYLITVSPKSLPHYEEIFRELVEKLTEFKPVVGYLFYEILDADIEINFDVLQITERKITKLEEDILNTKTALRAISKIIRRKRELLLMWRRFWGSSKIIFSIKKGLTPIKMDESLVRLLDDIHDTYIYQMEIIDAQRSILTDALTIFETTISNRLATISNTINTSIKKLTWIMLLLTGIATVLTIPNTVATIFGIPQLQEVVRLNLIFILLLFSTVFPVLWFVWYWRRIKIKEVAKK